MEEYIEKSSIIITYKICKFDPMVDAYPYLKYYLIKRNTN
jgi:hypothetical protein